MCVCSGKTRLSKPRLSASRASVAGWMASCVGKIASPNSMACAYPSCAWLTEIRGPRGLLLVFRHGVRRPQRRRLGTERLDVERVDRLPAQDGILSRRLPVEVEPQE